VLKVWAKRHRDLARARNQAACRLHAVLCDLVPGGHPREISAAQAARILERVTPSGAAARARCELAAEFLTDIRRLDAQLRHTNKKQAAAAGTKGPGGQPGNHSVSRAAGSHPAHRLFGQATPGPSTTLRPGATAGRAPRQPNRARQRPAGHLATASKKPQTTT
jgi:hypothetical protein